MQKLLSWLKQRPTLSFFILLGLLFGIIVLSSLSRNPEEIATLKTKESKTSTVFSVQEAGFVMATAQIKKTDVIDVVALTNGMVKSVHVRVGQKVSSGTPLVHITNDYGTESGRLAAQKADQYAHFSDRVYSLQKDILEREKRIAEKNSELTDREEKNAIDNLKVELERLKLNREIAKIDASLAHASDAALTPKSIFNGTVEYIGVRPGETVTAGTIIATIRGITDNASLVASLPDRIAHSLDPRGLATLITDSGEEITLTQGYLAQGENTLGLRSITFPLTPEVAHRFTNSEFVNIFVPLSNPQGQYFVPIDALLSGPQGSSVLVLTENNQVREKPIETGQVVGSFVLATSGLDINDQILLNRNVFPGDAVSVAR
jgi:RND family efflux transporter MFP subunit